MKRARLFLIPIAIFGLATTIYPTSVLAAKPANSSKPSTQSTGNDISWPQCGTALPKNAAFGIVGINDGTAATTNPCLATQLTWASRTSGTASQPRIQLYVNTANPGQVINQITTWPTSSTADNPFGNCAGQNDLACSWQYGHNRASEDATQRFTPAAQAAGITTNPGSYRWWLDVETANTWQSGSTAALANNVATLEGMVAYFESIGATAGLYSTSYQWSVIAGNQIGSTSNLNGLPDWLPGATSATNAQAKCASAPLTPNGQVTLTQYISRNVDYDYSCLK